MHNVAFINHKQHQCGVYQYGYRTGRILKNSTAYSFAYCEVESKEEFFSAVLPLNPIAIFYNYHPSTMSWIGSECFNAFPSAKHLGLHHEGGESGFFEWSVILDSTFKDSGNRISVLRPLFETVEANHKSPIPTIGSFGFGFGNKGFGRLSKVVNEQFDEAILRLHVPAAYYGDREGLAAPCVLSACQQQLKKSKIKLEMTTGFMGDEQLLDFLASNSLNAFLYDEMAPTRGLSSVIDYALSVRVPIAISKTVMFRHIYNTSPSICFEDRTLPEIMASGSEPLQQYRDLWSPNRFLERYEGIVKKVTGR